jgi:hypothetical protein
VSVKIMSLVWDRTDLSQAETLVLLALADRADDDGRCWPSIAGVAERARMTERSVQRVMRVMQERGFVAIEKGGGRKTNHYAINVEQLRGDIASPPNHPRQIVTGDTGVTPPPTQLCHPSGDTAMSPESSITTIEPSLDLDVWREWISYRKELKSVKAYTPSGAQRQMRWLARHTRDQQRQIVDNSIRQGYQGLFELKDSGNGTSRQVSKPRLSSVERVYAATASAFDDGDGTESGGGVAVNG